MNKSFKFGDKVTIENILSEGVVTCVNPKFNTVFVIFEGDTETKEYSVEAVTKLHQLKVGDNVVVKDQLDCGLGIIYEILSDGRVDVSFNEGGYSVVNRDKVLKVN
jgi:hypothetical protein